MCGRSPPTWTLNPKPKTARAVFSIVRDSRMWCPDDIGRDSWVWGEQGTLRSINSPHEVGEEALSEKISLSEENGVAQGCKWLLLLLNPNISLQIFIVEPGGPRRVAQLLHWPAIQRLRRLFFGKGSTSQTAPLLWCITGQQFSEQGLL